MDKKIVVWAVIVLLVLGNLYWLLQYRAALSAAQTAQAAQAAAQAAPALNAKVLDFEKLFIVKVLKAQGEINFDTRLQLETAVRATGDQEIINQWQHFVDSKTEADAQTAVKDLLNVLVNKIKSS